MPNLLTCITQLPCLPLGGQRSKTLWSLLDPTLRCTNSRRPPTSSLTPYRSSSPTTCHPSPSPCVKTSSGPSFLSMASALELPLPVGPTPLLSASSHSWETTLPFRPSASCSPHLG